MALSNAITVTNWDIMQAGALRNEIITKVKEEHNWSKKIVLNLKLKKEQS